MFGCVEHLAGLNYNDIYTTIIQFNEVIKISIIFNRTKIRNYLALLQKWNYFPVQYGNYSEFLKKYAKDKRFSLISNGILIKWAKFLQDNLYCYKQEGIYCQMVSNKISIKAGMIV